MKIKKIIKSLLTFTLVFSMILLVFGNRVVFENSNDIAENYIAHMLNITEMTSNLGLDTALLADIDKTLLASKEKQNTVKEFMNYIQSYLNIEYNNSFARISTKPEYDKSVLEKSKNNANGCNC